MNAPTTAPSGPERHRDLRRFGRIFVLFVAFWAALADLALPAVWKRAERQKMVEGRELVTRTNVGVAGNPINFGLIGGRAEVLCAFRAAGWTLARPSRRRAISRRPACVA